MKIKLFGREVEFEDLGGIGKNTTRYQALFRGVMVIAEVSKKSAKVSMHITHGTWLEAVGTDAQGAADVLAEQIRQLRTLLEGISAP